MLLVTGEQPKSVADRLRAPVFVIGYKRSGTTMLRLMLNAHTAFAIPGESEYFKSVPPAIGSGLHPAGNAMKIATSIAALPRCHFRTDTKVDDIFEIIEEVLPARTETILASLYRAWADSIGKPDARWGDKKPHHWQYVYRLHQWYPDARFLFIVRDPRDVVASVETHFPEQVIGRSILAPHLITAWQWRRSTLEMERQAQNLQERLLVLPYEDLVADPEQHARRICEFLGESYDPAMLDFQEQAQDPRIQGADPAGGAHQQSTRQIHTGRVGHLRKSRLTESSTSDIEFICGDVFGRFGWTPEAPPPPPWRRAQLRGLCTSMDLAWRLLRLRRRSRGGL